MRTIHFRRKSLWILFPRDAKAERFSAGTNYGRIDVQECQAQSARALKTVSVPDQGIHLGASQGEI